jgi:hypothetical protein
MMRSVKFKAAAITIASAIVAAAPGLANACATCGLSEGSHAFRAYQTSALFLVASPYVSFFAIGGVVYFVYRRSQRQNHDGDPKR